MDLPFSINHCYDCGIHIPVRLPREAEQCRSWECKNCGAVTLGVFDEAARSTIATNVAQLRQTVQPAGVASEQIMRLIDAIETCLCMTPLSRDKRVGANRLTDEAHFPAPHSSTHTQDSALQMRQGLGQVSSEADAGTERLMRAAI